MDTLAACGLRLRWWNILSNCMDLPVSSDSRRALVKQALKSIPWTTRVSDFAMQEVKAYCHHHGRTPPSNNQVALWANGRELMWQVAVAALALASVEQQNLVKYCYEDILEGSPTQPTSSTMPESSNLAVPPEKEIGARPKIRK